MAAKQVAALRVAVVLSTVFAVFLPVGCGQTGAHPGQRTGVQPRVDNSSERDEKAGREAVLSQLPPADRAAYFHMTTVAGVVTGTAALAAVAHVQDRNNLRRLRTLRRRIAILRPRDLMLAQLRRELLATLDAATRANRGRRWSASAAGNTGAAVASILRGLTRYARAHPAVSAFVPD